MNIETVRTALASALELSVQGVSINPYARSAPTPPGLQILPPGVEYDQAMHRGLDRWTFILQGFVPFVTDVGGQKLLDRLCAPTGTGSVKAAIELDRTLGGVVQDAWVKSQTPARMVERGDGTPMLLVEWELQILGN